MATDDSIDRKDNDEENLDVPFEEDLNGWGQIQDDPDVQTPEIIEEASIPDADIPPDEEYVVAIPGEPPLQIVGDNVDPPPAPVSNVLAEAWEASGKVEFPTAAPVEKATPEESKDSLSAIKPLPTGSLWGELDSLPPDAPDPDQPPESTAPAELPEPVSTLEEPALEPEPAHSTAVTEPPLIAEEEPPSSLATETPPDPLLAEEIPATTLASEEISVEEDEQEVERKPSQLPFDPLPLDGPPPTGDSSWLFSYESFKAEVQKLARMGNWKKLAAVTGHALLHAPYARRMTRTSMLLDLARIYRDRLRDEKRTEQTFAILAEEEPANAEALLYLVDSYERRAEWGEIFDLYQAAIEATWDPNDRLSWTQLSASLATNQLQNVSLAIKAWEHLWHLGDAVEEASRELARLYRQAGRWEDLAGFLQRQADRLEGAGRLVILRELAEVKLTGLQDPDGASQVLEQIVAASPGDPIATLQLARVYAQRQDWAALERLGESAGTDESLTPGAIDLQHLIADSLWQAGRLEQAIVAYDRILQIKPSDPDGTSRKKEFLIQTERHEELLALLLAKVEATDDDEERLTLLAETATIADEMLNDPERAAKLWERRITIDSEHLPSYQALTRLYEAVSDLRGIARSLEGQLSLIKPPPERATLLTRLGEHYAVRMGDDDRAEGCWKEILSIDPGNISAREELIKLHRRRGDFESLNSALMRQIWLTTDEQRAEMLCRIAAENLDDNFKEPVRSVEAWRRVLDFSPLDLQALRSLARHYTTLEFKRDLIATLEQEIRAVDELPIKIDRALQVAQLWKEEGVTKPAAATYERILQWDPVNPRALDGLVAIYREAQQPGRAAGVLEHACTMTREPAERIKLLRRILELLPADDHMQRFYLLRRILHLAEGDRTIVEELMSVAESAKCWPEMAALLTQLACQQDLPAVRIDLLRELAWVCEKKLQYPVRAYLAMQSVLISPENQARVLEEVTRLARENQRFEDLLAVLDALTTPDFDLAQRKEIIRTRAEICAKEMKDPTRAFHEFRRLVELDPDDWTPLADLEQLASENNMWIQLDAVFGELGDRTTEMKQVLDLLARREEIARQKLNARPAAFDLLVRRYRLDIQDLDLLRQLTEDAEATKGWDWLLPLIEGTQLFGDGSASAKELAVTAALYEGKLNDQAHAFDLYASAFMTSPDERDLIERLEDLAAKTDRHDFLADTYRIAAAIDKDPEQPIDLLRRIARIYEQQLNAAARAIDIHRRLLTLKDNELPSLAVMVSWHRQRSEWRDLRDRLRQWTRLTDSTEEKVAKLLEIAEISERYLLDSEEALQTYGQVLDLDPPNTTARAGLNGLMGSITEPSLRYRWLEMELKTSEAERAPRLRLEIAQIKEEELGDLQGAIDTLREVVTDVGPQGPGFETLSRLLHTTKQWSEVVLLLKEKADRVEDAEIKLAAMEEAIAIFQEHLSGTNDALCEELYRSLLVLRPDDRPTRIQLAQLLRRAGRFEDLSQLLEENLQYLLAPTDQQETLAELGRIYALNLQRMPDATACWENILHQAPTEQGAILALARAAYLQGDIPSYVTFREQQAKLLPPQESALVLCHLAEVADEHAELNPRMVPFYREARSIDSNNIPAMEALKGIGRRLKNLRPAAALLPLEGERELDREARAERLKGLGDNTLETDLRQSIEWYYRAAAVNPDSPDTWQALAAALARLPDPEAHHRALASWFQSSARTSPLQPARLLEEAEQLFQLADSARQQGDPATYQLLIRRAHELAPHHAPSSLAISQTMIEEGMFDAAYSLLHTVLTHHLDELSDEQRMLALYNRALTLRHKGQVEQAITDVRDALRWQPLHAESLIALGEMQAAQGLPAAALEHQIRALIVTRDPEARARLYFRLGMLWEDGLAAKAEAGACYELALAEGLTERELLHRSLRHFQRTGRLDQSLDVVDGLLPTAQDSDELATLWLVRGEIFAEREGFEDQAIEAFDMALSYDPTRQEARDGLTKVLEKREDWQQLLQILEATCDVGTPAQQSMAYQRMATICSESLSDADRAEQYLRQAVLVHPTREALEELEKIYTVESGRLDERKEILGLLVGFGPPWFERCLELAKLLLAEDKTWAWCLLSPLLGVSQVDADMKAVVQAMRKEYEKPPVLCPPKEELKHLRHLDEEEQLTEVLALLGEVVSPLGYASLDEAGDGNAFAINESTSLGKSFLKIAETMDLAGTTLYRSQDLPESVCIINSRPDPMVIIRTEVIQQLVHAEVGFLFAYALELTRPGHRLVAALPKDSRDQLIPALWLALGFSAKGSKQATRLSERIIEATDEDQRKSWAKKLAPLKEQDPIQLGRSWWRGVNFTALRAGLLGGADLRQVFRVASRLEESIPRPRVVARLEELDDYLQGSEILQAIVAYAASPSFGQLLKQATVAVEL